MVQPIESQNADRNGTSVKEFHFVLICKKTGRDGLQETTTLSNLMSIKADRQKTYR